MGSVTAERFKCPDCRGTKGWLVPVECVAMYEHEDMDDCGCPRTWHPCPTCRETGEVDAIQRAIFVARGGSAAVQLRGFA